MTSILLQFDNELSHLSDSSDVDSMIASIDQHMAIYVALHFPIYAAPCKDTKKCVSYIKDKPFYL
jgi:hypothetical protein